MDKVNALLVLDEPGLSMMSLTLPAQLTAALQANDQLKLYLTLLQQAVQHAREPGVALPDLGRELDQAGLSGGEDAHWLQAWPRQSEESLQGIRLPDWTLLAGRMAGALALMARPLQGQLPSDDPLALRIEHWLHWLREQPGEYLTTAQIEALTRGPASGAKRAAADLSDSLHLLVMDLHRGLNKLSAEAAGAGGDIDGAHAWKLAEDGSDEPRVRAFMRGVNRTRPLKFDHPGLGSCATRDGGRLLIQNDIGTNDAHVLVLQVETPPGQPAQIRLTYSDLHTQRFAFFQELLAEVGADWGPVAARVAAGLNAGAAFHVGTACFVAADEIALCACLEGIGERIVFLIDWNRARKRLQNFVDKPAAVVVLKQAAAQRWGHMAWLKAGGERLVWDAMAAQGPATFRLGDRLDDVLGATPAREFLVELLALAHRHALQPQSTALLADEARALLGRRLRQRHGEFDGLEEHAGLCQALAQALADEINSPSLQPDSARALAERAKKWERRADHLVIRARQLADRVPQWASLVHQLELGDDVADAIEEACFVWQMLAEYAHEHAHPKGQRPWSGEVQQPLMLLADTVLQATQDHIKALGIARTLGEGSEPGDHDEFLAASWRVLQAERRSDELHRQVRMALIADERSRSDVVAFQLGLDLSGALEQAGDALLRQAHALRDRAFRRIDAAGN
ncbi:phosphate transport regulator [Paucibacter sp. APW11]|uniref:Phosphate transport regulator n=1 Tax=Roseateles aquae TaxID=3077235 RepID=A0ABU3PG42_9BURK|nr:phosphate transport regulator [Paucibacter sp. APW11]MDT9001078.1 phosphate transport regulator [Paucibacter sp. APW11]